jgi:CheY-like chemotaxis protein
VARVLICEPHADIRALLSFVVRRLGHEAILCDGTKTQLFGVDAIVFEPGHPQALAVAQWAREHTPHTALICTSIFPPSAETDALEPDDYLVKPFPLYRLEQALSLALAERSAVPAGGAR